MSDNHTYDDCYPCKAREILIIAVTFCQQELNYLSANGDTESMLRIQFLVNWSLDVETMDLSNPCNVETLTAIASMKMETRLRELLYLLGLESPNVAFQVCPKLFLFVKFEFQLSYHLWNICWLQWKTWLSSDFVISFLLERWRSSFVLSETT